jgi:hypothetical protein
VACIYSGQDTKGENMKFTLLTLLLVVSAASNAQFSNLRSGDYHYISTPDGLKVFQVYEEDGFPQVHDGQVTMWDHYQRTSVTPAQIGVKLDTQGSDEYLVTQVPATGRRDSRRITIERVFRRINTPVSPESATKSVAYEVLGESRPRIVMESDRARTQSQVVPADLLPELIEKYRGKPEIKIEVSTESMSQLGFEAGLREKNSLMRRFLKGRDVSDKQETSRKRLVDLVHALSERPNYAETDTYWKGPLLRNAPEERRWEVSELLRQAENHSQPSPHEAVREIARQLSKVGAQR